MGLAHHAGVVRLAGFERVLLALHVRDGLAYRGQPRSRGLQPVLDVAAKLGQVGGQPLALYGHLLFQPRLPGLEGQKSPVDIVETFGLAPCRIQAAETLQYLLAALRQGVVLGGAPLVASPLPVQRVYLGPARGRPCLQDIALLAHIPQELDPTPLRVDAGPGGLDRGGKPLYGRPGLLQNSLMLFPGLQAALELGDRYVGFLDVVLYQGTLGLRALLKVVVVREVEHLSETLLPLRGLAPGEHVRTALQQECGVHEGVVVHMNYVSDEGLGIAYGVSGYGAVAVAGGGLQVKQSRALAPGGGPRIASQDAVALAPGGELQLDAHGALALVY